MDLGFKGLIGLVVAAIFCLKHIRDFGLRKLLKDDAEIWVSSLYPENTMQLPPKSLVFLVSLIIEPMPKRTPSIYSTESIASYFQKILR